MRKVVSILLLMSMTCQAFAADIYFTQAGAGGATGADCANAYAMTRFNTNDPNWTAGNTLHFCSGTFTTAATAQASGSAGNPITLKFESGAMFSKAAWAATGAIVCSGKSYITVDGGTNGTIQNTDNGQSLGNQVESIGVKFTTCDNAIIKNLSVLAMYVKTQNVDSGLGAASAGINVSNSSNCLITNNVTTDAQAGIGGGPDTADITSCEISSNTLTNCNRCIDFGTATNTITTLLVHDNDLGGGAWLWDEPSNDLHHNAIHIFNTTSGHVNGLQIYNNYTHGIWGKDNSQNHTTSMIFLETLANTGPAYVFNNLMVAADHDSMPTNGFIFCKVSGTCDLYNNTIVGVNDGSHFGTAIGCNKPQTVNSQNNIIEYMTAYFSCDWSTVNQNDYNDVDSWDGHTYLAWQGLGFDINGSNLNPNLDGSYKPTGSSAAINTLGADLHSTGIGALNADKSGVSRPNSAWTSGAYQYIAASGGVVSLLGGILFKAGVVMK